MWSFQNISDFSEKKQIVCSEQLEVCFGGAGLWLNLAVSDLKFVCPSLTLHPWPTPDAHFIGCRSEIGKKGSRIGWLCTYVTNIKAYLIIFYFFKLGQNVTDQNTLWQCKVPGNEMVAVEKQGHRGYRCFPREGIFGSLWILVAWVWEGKDWGRHANETSSVPFEEDQL